ncbi:olfactory receptor 4F6-like [Callorhinus ursinus]|uniref:Olfactory receptor 4F6-like n=1 Tax=Callorhinus ursinus TaxID=34884 RepID=A0A3Q7RGC6_CALUR|nr:olfactory receptor 4F6-like [Callorhinus ursinus]
MDTTNDSMVSEFVLIGLSNSWEMHHFLFWFFAVFYMGIILGSLFIVLMVITDSRLHSPMYFLLANFSLLDLGLSSTTVPKTISDLFTDCNIISLPKYMTQIFFIHIMGGGEMVQLIAMAYDWYTEICKPLHYLTIMSPKMCVSFVVAAWIVGIIHAVFQFVFVINLPFCGPNEVDNFYCDCPRVMKLACVGTYKLEFIIIANSGFISMVTVFSLIISYILYLHFVCKRSSGDLSKAFVTLSAHISVVILFFMPCIFLYVGPFPTTSLDKYLFIVDSAITPVLNPAIYTLRNKDMRVAMRRLCKRIVGPHGISK